MPEEMSSFPAMVCPFDRLQLDGSGHGTFLECAKGHRYPVRLGIPRLLAAETNYADAFGEQWQRYPRTQLDSYTRTNISRDRLKRCLGDDLWCRLQGSDRLEILETGCGAGRFTEILLQLSGASVTSTDLSSAVEPNQINAPQSDRHRIIQCDINQLPFLPEQYDIVLCLGVIQHTKDPEKTIVDLYHQVKPGGWLIIDHYTHSLSNYTKVSARLLRPILKRLSPSKGLVATKALTRLFFPLHRAVRNRKPLQMVLSRVSPLLTYYHAFPELNDKLQYEWAELDTHDSLTDYYKHLRSPRAIHAAIEALGAQNIWVAKGGNGVEARCQKPAPASQGCALPE
jgi:2-polyprenyl-3-methyl-5-hydroxy-6-metoxy-1,4-benzoquinol methylase